MFGGNAPFNSEDVIDWVLMHLQKTIAQNRHQWSSDDGDTLGACHHASWMVEIDVVIERIWKYPSQAVIECIWRCTWRLWLSNIGDIHLEAINLTTWRPSSIKYRDKLGGHGGCYLEAVIKQVWRCTWTPFTCKLQGRNQVTLEIHLEAMIVCTWKL